MPLHSAARIRSGLRPVDWSASCGFAFALGLVWVARFSISRISWDPSKSMYRKALDAIFGSISLGSFLVLPLFLGSQGNRSDR